MAWQVHKSGIFYDDSNADTVAAAETEQQYDYLYDNEAIVEGYGQAEAEQVQNAAPGVGSVPDPEVLARSYRDAVKLGVKTVDTRANFNDGDDTSKTKSGLSKAALAQRHADADSPRNRRLRGEAKQRQSPKAIVKDETTTDWY